MAYEIAAHAGFCMGVRRAVESAVQVADSGVPSCTLGELIHNPTVVDMLRQRGIPPVASAEEAAGRQVLIRSHGVAPEVIRQLEKAGCKVVDLTCPFVNKLHRVVAEDTGEDCPLIMVGEREHPEVKGTCGWARGKVYVVATAEEAAQLPEMDQAAAAVQTTFPPERWEAIVAVLRGRVQHLKEHNTICNATAVRQREAKKLAAASDAMIVVGGRTSANTHKLFEACKALCPRTILVECAAEIPPAFANIHSDKIGITAGASTPDGSLEEVATHMTDNENMAQSSDFTMDAIVATMTRIKAGQTVTGKVVQVTPDEVYVNIGYKADGIIKRSDLTQQDVKEGDELEAEIVKVNDGEGNVVLSQRNIVNRKAWEALVAKYDAGEYVKGVGKEAVKGGLIANVGGVRAFIPASQLSQRYVEKIEDFVGKDMKLKIIEVDKQKRRLVASRKAVLAEESAAAKAAAWEKLEVGTIVHGIVRRLTDFGAFVDIGGVDGLIHITDLSWGRVKHPSDVVKPGDEVDVLVLALDRERERISLGLKQTKPKPWETAQVNYPVGSICEGKVVRIVTFGAFVELEPGLDGLVHISQIAPTRINKVEDVLHVGDMVRVRILDVNPEAKRISLSIRDAAEPAEAENGDMELGDLPDEI